MPELPEVETVKNVLLKIVKDRKIKSVDINRQSTVLDEPSFFIKELKGTHFINITRMGKFLIFHLSENKVLISHLRMEGKYIELDESQMDTPYARVVFHLDNGHKLCYDDSRSFGRMKLSSEKDYKSEKELAKLGPEPFYIDDVQYLKNRTKNSNVPIKTTLLDQTLMTGLGNIYADETLFKSQIHPLVPAKKITLKQWEIIKNNACIILNEAIEQGGSTIRSYHPGKDIDGSFQVRLKAYGKGDENCPNCNTPFRFMKVNGRGTTFCPKCQVKKYAPIRVAIVGKIASGKSTVTSIFKTHHFPTISCDDIVATLYQRKETAKLLKDAFGLPFKNKVDKKLLREYLVLHKDKKKRLERLIHPLVLKEVETFQKRHNKKISIVEIPLLYESNAENMFDVIIAVDVNSGIQMERLSLRNGATADQLAYINSNNKFDKNKIRADYVINNNGSPDELTNRVEEIINKLTSRLN